MVSYYFITFNFFSFYLSFFLFVGSATNLNPSSNSLTLIAIVQSFYLSSVIQHHRRPTSSSSNIVIQLIVVQRHRRPTSSSNVVVVFSAILNEVGERTNLNPSSISLASIAIAHHCRPASSTQYVVYGTLCHPMHYSR